MRREMNLTAPINRADGLTQSKVKVDSIHFRDDKIIVRTAQRNSIALNYTPARAKFLENIEDKIAAILSGTEVEDPEPEPQGP